MLLCGLFNKWKKNRNIIKIINESDDIILNKLNEKVELAEHNYYNNDNDPSHLLRLIQARNMRKNYINNLKNKNKNNTYTNNETIIDLT